MSLTEREQLLFNKIKDWENQLFNYEPNDLQLTYDKYLTRSFSLLPEHIQQQFFSVMDNWLFHLHALIQGTQLQVDAKERILSAGRIFRSDIESVEDMRLLTIDQLQYIAQQQIARHRFYSFAQGGLSGTGGTLLLGSDIPAIAVINLRVVQLIAATYGFEVNNPFEMMTSLKVFHSATLPVRLQGQAWNELMDQLMSAEDYYFYEGPEELTDVTWLEQPVKQLFKGLTILMFKRKSSQKLPLISMAIGAGANYQLTRRVTEFAHHYYQMRYLLEKKEQVM